MFLEKISREPEALSGADVQAVREAGVIDEAILIGTLFRVINRILNAVGAGPIDGPGGTWPSARSGASATATPLWYACCPVRGEAAPQSDRKEGA